MSRLGIDAGTSGCKAAVFSETGQQLTIAYEEYDIAHPGWDELDAVEVWSRIKQAIGRVTVAARGAGTDPIRALAVSSMGEAFVLVTFDRRILGPSILLSDSRGAEYLPRLRRELSDERLYAINGNTAGDWSPELLAWGGIASAKLPATVPSGTVIGQVARHVAGELGLPPGIPIVAGAHDQCANAVGCGVIREGLAWARTSSRLTRRASRRWCGWSATSSRMRSKGGCTPPGSSATGRSGRWYGSI